MSYLLEGLLQMRRNREERALRELAQSRAQMSAAAAALEAARRALDEYRVWRPQEENRQWQGILGREVRSRDLDTHKKRLQTIAEGEIARAAAVQQADKAWQAARDACEQKRVAHVRTLRNVEKLEEHKKLELQREAAEAERLLEVELEDLQFHAQPEF